MAETEEADYQYALAKDVRYFLNRLDSVGLALLMHRLRQDDRRYWRLPASIRMIDADRHQGLHTYQPACECCLIEQVDFVWRFFAKDTHKTAVGRCECENCAWLRRPRRPRLNKLQFHLWWLYRSGGPLTPLSSEKAIQ